ncbi:PREDICTED: uncharacterized protein LOC109115767 [Nelumbo nucifera]|uniref:Uncharacterized protein LOC109115767 n=1 Tax=Nelumbo nucifera TaxID=4432 RepID=A0A1U8QA34_NELNU|nr:PREDICTED: uncharacterized protein LOC109115767 [Nelumbo nucifera]
MYNAFLHGYLDEEVFMLPPPSYTKAKPNEVCLSKRSLYGLKQVSRQWNVEFCAKLQAYGFVQSAHDHCLFIKKTSTSILALLVYVDDVLVTGTHESEIKKVKQFLHEKHGSAHYHCLFTKKTSTSILALLVYVDDVLVTGTHESEIKKVKQFLHDTFTIKDMEYAKYFLGLKIARGSDGTYVNQRKYVLDILQDFGLLGAKPIVTSLPKGQKFSSTVSYLDEPEKYCKLVGRLLYLNLTRPDISYVVQQLSQYVHSHTQDHWQATLHVLKYLKGTPSRGLFFSSNNNLSLEAFCDADWAACKESCKSLTVSRSSAEAEYRSLAFTVCELQWISYILQDFQVSPPLPIPLWCNNMAALHITINSVFHKTYKAPTD